MTDPRWTDETAECVLNAINECDLGDDYAAAVLAALAAAGLLVLPGGETREYWGVLGENGIEYCDDEEYARQQLARFYTRHKTAKVVRRTVHFGDWRDVS